MTDEAKGLLPKFPGEILSLNLSEPILLTDVRVDGVAAESAAEGSPVRLWTRLFLTSDSPFFHRVIEGLELLIADAARRVGSPINLQQANSILLVIHADATAKLWMDTAAVSFAAMAKRAVSAGEPILERDIIDIVAVDFPDVEINSSDKIIYVFREAWRFGLGFDFNPEKEFDRDTFARGLGTLFRKLKYRHLYELLENPTQFTQLTAAGWFPFSEIIGHEFKDLLRASEAGFPLAETEAKLLAAFGTDRIDRILARWLLKPHFKLKERLLVSALNAYKSNDPVAVLKIILTEIEGVLANAYGTTVGSRANLADLLKFATDAAERKAGAPDTLFFPAAFAEYLRTYTYAKFDRSTNDIQAGSRHAVGHGAAEAESYTQTRALQAILTLDQLAFYT
jgi:hypothetical protein